MKIKYKIGDNVIVISENPLRVKKFTIGGIFINEDGLSYNDGINLGPQHTYLEENVFKTQKEALARAEKLIGVKVGEYKAKLIEGIANE